MHGHARIWTATDLYQRIRRTPDTRLTYRRPITAEWEKNHGHLKRILQRNQVFGERSDLRDDYFRQFTAQGTDTHTMTTFMVRGLRTRRYCSSMMQCMWWMLLAIRAAGLDFPPWEVQPDAYEQPRGW